VIFHAQISVRHCNTASLDIVTGFFYPIQQKYSHEERNILIPPCCGLTPWSFRISEQTPLTLDAAASRRAAKAS
jgi:hypothetical protein